MTRSDARGSRHHDPDGPHGLHVLYVAWEFLPHDGPGVPRQLATVAELVREGHRVTVLTADLDTFDQVMARDRSHLDDLPEAEQVVRVAMAPRQRDPLVNRWPAVRMSKAKVWLEAVEKEQVAAFPEQVYAPWQPRAEAVATRIHELDPVDLVIASGAPYVDFSVALRLHVDHGVPFVLDDSGSWLTDPSTGEQNPLAERILPWVEFALSQAVRMWFVSPPIADWHRQRFPQYADRIRVVGSEADDAQRQVAVPHGAAQNQADDAQPEVAIPHGAAISRQAALGPALQDVVSALAS